MLTISLQVSLRAGFHSTDKDKGTLVSYEPKTTVTKEHSVWSLCHLTPKSIALPSGYGALTLCSSIRHFRTFVLISKTSYVWKITSLSHIL